MTIIYDNDKILECWKYIFYNYESFDFDHFDDKQEVSNLIDELDKFFNKPILALIESNEEIYLKTKEISEIFQKNINFINYSDSRRIIDNLERLNIYFNDIPNINFWVELYKQSDSQFQKAEKERNDKSAQNRQVFSIGKLDKEFSDEYERFANWLFFKQFLFYVVLLSSIFIISDILKYIFIYHHSDVYGQFFIRFVIYAPFLIVILFLIWQIKQDRKFAQIYLHKRVIARSYINYMNALNDRDFGSKDLEIKNRMQEELLKAIIDVMKDNPVDYLSKNKNNDSYQIIIEKLIDKIPIIKNKE
ncbi:hypothetical protein ACT2CV_08115 [Pasteurellaceae bacterium 22721_9_1]